MSDRFDFAAQYPAVYLDPQFEAIQSAAGEACRRASNDLDFTIKQLLPITASGWGLEWWELAHGIAVAPAKSTGQRRARVLAKVRSQRFPDVSMIRDVAQSFASATVVVTEEASEFLFELSFVPSEDFEPAIDDLIDAINEVKPAHMAMSVVMMQYLDAHITLTSTLGQGYTATPLPQREPDPAIGTTLTALSGAGGDIITTPLRGGF